jgi:hypothetical protein
VGSAILLSALFFPVDPVDAYEGLSDEQLDLVTAGTASAVRAGDKLDLEFLTKLRSGATVNGTGALQVRAGHSPPSDVGKLVISDNAQGNLNAVINVNAVNSPVQVLLNLNINVNSNIGGIEQINISGPNGPLMLPQ